MALNNRTDRTMPESCNLENVERYRMYKTEQYTSCTKSSEVDDNYYTDISCSHGFLTHERAHVHLPAFHQSSSLVRRASRNMIKSLLLWGRFSSFVNACPFMRALKADTPMAAPHVQNNWHGVAFRKRCFLRKPYWPWLELPILSLEVFSLLFVLQS